METRLSEADIRNAYAHHPPKEGAAGGDVAAHNTVRNVLADAAVALNQVVPEGRYKSLMMTALETARVWGNTAVAIDWRVTDDAES